MRWAIENFVSKELDALTEGDWLNLEHEFFAFAVEPLAFRRLRSWTRFNKPIPPPSKQELRDIQGTWRGLIARVLEKPEGEPVLLARMPNTTLTVQRFRTRTLFHQRFGAGEKWDAVATPRFIQLMGGFAHHIRECGECHRLFFAVRLKKQTYCSQRCKTRVSVRKFRENQAKKKKSRATSAN
jgi:hypothetical protein